MMNDFSNELTAAEAERLALLAEECAEVIAIVGKILRHGYESRNPHDVAAVGNAALTNRQMLESELGDVLCAKGLLETANDVSASEVSEHRQRAWPKKRPYLHHQ